MQLSQDIVILGGGIAGLWLLHRLRAAGYAAVLLEKNSLGDGQTIASQGMIHGGLKYTLGGALTGASEAIAGMPAHWQNCLRGEGDVDLRGTRLLSDAYYMLPRSSMRSRMTAFLGSKIVSGKTHEVAKDAMPEFFRNHLDGPLYRMHDIVLDVPSLLHVLGERHKSWIYRADCQIEQDANGTLTAIVLPDGRRLLAKLFICTSGNGNLQWLQQLTGTVKAMQQRPLQMVVVKHHFSSPLYAHCVGDDFSATPELTVTTHHCLDGRTAWYLGGELAERGAQMSSIALLDAARTKLQALFPWCKLENASYHSVAINRAEARQPDGKRPDGNNVLQHRNVLFCWPTKLTLAPALADSVMKTITASGLLPNVNASTTIEGFSYPGVADPPWERL